MTNVSYLMTNDGNLKSDALRHSSAGFTLIEITVVAAITVLFASILVQNFSKSRTDLGIEAIFAGDAVREAQSLALSGTVRGELRCGYGIVFREDGTGYDIYAGPEVDPRFGCPEEPTRRIAGTEVIRSASLGNAVLEVRTGGRAQDFFFAPPVPTVYSNGADFTSQEVSICRKGTDDCQSITVYASGVISTSK